MSSQEGKGSYLFTSVSKLVPVFVSPGYCVEVWYGSPSVRIGQHLWGTEARFLTGDRDLFISENCF